MILPAHGQSAWLQEQVGGLPEASYYHPDAVLHVHGNGLAEHLPLNPVTWTLASAWRGAQLPYLLAGPAVITGTEDHDGNLTPLPAPPRHPDSQGHRGGHRVVARESPLPAPLAVQPGQPRLRPRHQRHSPRSLTPATPPRSRPHAQF
ncbi:DUF3846 domain-containing protein [Streptomyces sp. NPDC047987]|uniref:DUF3846 domain-containing protein n=1 Tax=unclassified Streptomyces TaxID=2593676 RepID=UPI0034131FA5